MQKISNGLLAVACLLLAGTVNASETPLEGDDADSLLTREDVGSVSLAHWTERWWQWAMTMPITPYRDPDGRFCDMGQSGPVWFLAGTDGSFDAARTCIIPADTHVLVPIINVMRISVPKQPRDCGQLQREVAVNNDHLVSAVALLDGKPLGDLSLQRVRSDGCFTMVYDDDQRMLAAADGYWLMLKPLSRGVHTLVIGANYGAKRVTHGMMRQNFEYRLEVGGRNLFSDARMLSSPVPHRGAAD